MAGPLHDLFKQSEQYVSLSGTWIEIAMICIWLKIPGLVFFTSAFANLCVDPVLLVVIFPCAFFIPIL